MARRSRSTIPALATVCLAALLAAVLLRREAGIGQPEAPAEGGYNVILILVDTLRADHLGSYGYHRPISPNLDAFAADNLLFENATSQAGCTFPSVNSMLTSRNPARFLKQPRGHLGIPASIPSLPQILRARGYRTLAVSASPIVRNAPSKHNKYGGYGEGFDSFDEQCLWREAACVNQTALRILDTVSPGKGPLLLYLHYIDPHGHYRPPETHRLRFARPYQGKEFIRLGNPNPIESMLYHGGPDVDLNDRDLEHLVDLYDEEIAYFDEQFGLLLDALEQRDLLDDSLLVVLSDHGEEFLGHGNIKHCHSVYQSLVGTPLIIQLPAPLRGAARRLKTPVQNLAIVPTALDYLGIDASGYGFKGRSLRSLIESGDGFEQRLAFSSQSTFRSVRNKRYKLIIDLREDDQQLFDLQQDPRERERIERRRSDAGEAEILKRLRRELFAWVFATEGRDLQRSLDAARQTEEQLRALGYL
jgi:arylsulfatase A-like enzyme